MARPSREIPIRTNLVDSLKWISEHGIWDMLQTVVLVGSVLIGVKLLFFPRTRVRHLNFSTRIRQGDPDFPLRVDLEIRNLTGRTAVISNAWFEFGKLRPDARSQGDTPSGEFEVKFPGPDGRTLTEVEYLVRTQGVLVHLHPARPSPDGARGGGRTRRPPSGGHHLHRDLVGRTAPQPAAQAEAVTDCAGPPSQTLRDPAGAFL